MGFNLFTLDDINEPFPPMAPQMIEVLHWNAAAVGLRLDRRPTPPAQLLSFDWTMPQLTHCITAMHFMMTADVTITSQF